MNTASFSSRNMQSLSPSPIRSQFLSLIKVKQYELNEGAVIGLARGETE